MTSEVRESQLFSYGPERQQCSIKYCSDIIGIFGLLYNITQSTRKLCIALPDLRPL